MRSCTGAIVSFSALPGPSGSGSSSVSPVELDALARQRHAHDRDVLARALRAAWRSAAPCQPSATCGPEEPMPSSMRPLGELVDRRRRHRRHGGERPGIWKIAEPSRIFVVCPASQPRTVAASEP